LRGTGNVVSKRVTRLVKMAEQNKPADVNLAAFYSELNKFGNNGDYNRAIKVAKKSKCILFSCKQSSDLKDGQPLKKCCAGSCHALFIYIFSHLFTF